MNGLKINEEKTELLHISSRFRTRSQLPPITFDGPPLEPSSYARNLGIMVDDQLTLKRHVGNMCRSASYAIHKIGKLRRYLDQATTEKLVHAFVMSRIDNCNSLLFGLPDSLIDKVQRVQNCAARIVSRKRKRDHITPVLYDLHWLPVRDRISFKLLTIAYKCKHNDTPMYLQNIISSHLPTRNLRSSSKHTFTPLVTSTKTYGHRAFQYAIPKLWNNLPESLKRCPSLHQFKSDLKTYLFRSCQS